MSISDADREFDEQRTEARHQAELTHREHAHIEPESARIEAGYAVGCGICFEDYIDASLGGRLAESCPVCAAGDDCPDSE